ncbi:unnamed protein product [Cylicocyclus nassatus]|uniref:N-acetyltransferase domain-containing protein n=1 Tax=Cylicocyclus nassatus TaxID=53992 RepID=A0AA36GDI3_CYLNA|nr:unnamed protein product [Cylicocyclus nassatus]
MEKSLKNVEIVTNPDSNHWHEIVEWMAKEVEWPFTHEDLDTWKKSFCGKFWLYVAVVKETKQAIGCVMLMSEPPASGKADDIVYILGIYYVREEWRKYGVGNALFSKIMEVAHGSNVALIAEPSMSPKYASKYGFDKMPKFRNDMAIIPTEHIVIPKADPNYILKDINEVDAKKLAVYDSSASMFNRAEYLLNFISSSNCYTKVAVNQSREIVGYCCIRAVLANYLMMTPLYADDEAVARTLLAGVLPMIKNIRSYKRLESYYPAVNKQAHSLFESLGGGHTMIKIHSQSAFTKKIVPIAGEKVFGMLISANGYV